MNEHGVRADYDFRYQRERGLYRLNRPNMDRPVTSIPVDKFRSDTDHFDTWIKYFEDAIEVTHPNADPATKERLCIKWFLLKLDDKARLTHSGVTGANWAEIKQNFKEASKDPEEEYNWHARRVTITWDGVESFQSLETRIKRKVDTYHKDNREHEYFYRFRLALPKDYKRAIDVGCKKENRTIAEARAIAERVRLSLVEDETESGSATATNGAASAQQPRAVSFAGAAMSEDRLKSLEMALQGMSVRMENVETSLTSNSSSRDHSSDRDRDGRGRDNRSSSRGDGRHDRRDSFDRGRRNGSRDSRDRRGDRYRAYSGERSYYDRSRRDSYDRRDRDRDYRDRSRDRDRARGSRRSEETSRSKSREQDNLGTEDWSDDEIGDASGDTQDIHRNVADELANFDKQFGSAAHHSSNE